MVGARSERGAETRGDRVAEDEGGGGTEVRPGRAQGRTVVRVHHGVVHRRVVQRIAAVHHGLGCCQVERAEERWRKGEAERKGGRGVSTHPATNPRTLLPASRPEPCSLAVVCLSVCLPASRSACNPTYAQSQKQNIAGPHRSTSAAGDVQGASGSTAVFAAACAEPLIPTCWKAQYLNTVHHGCTDR